MVILECNEFEVSLSQTEVAVQSNVRAGLGGSGGNLILIPVCLAQLPLRQASYPQCTPMHYLPA